MVQGKELVSMLSFQKSNRFGDSRTLQNTGSALSYIARWENWYAAGNFGQERL